MHLESIRLDLTFKNISEQSFKLLAFSFSDIYILNRALYIALLSFITELL